MCELSLGLYGLLSPFKWEHVFIPIVPSYLCNILEAPVPFIIGLNKGANYFANESFTISDSAIIVDLDSGTVSFAGAKQTVEDFPSLRIALSEFNTLYNSEHLPSHKELLREVCKKVKYTLKRSVMSSLMKLSILREEVESGIEKVKALVKECALEGDKDFIGKFAETQMFVSYIEDRYVNSP